MNLSGFIQVCLSLSHVVVGSGPKKEGFSCPARRVRLAADERKLQNGHADIGAVLGTSDLRHSGTVPNAGRIYGCYRSNHFYESLPESSYNPIKHYVLLHKTSYSAVLVK